MNFKKDTYVTVSVKTLYESGIVLERCHIETQKNDTGNIGYWDLYNRHNELCCMDGESCLITAVSEEFITLKNKDGERDITFELTIQEAEKCCFGYPDTLMKFTSSEGRQIVFDDYVDNTVDYGNYWVDMCQHCLNKYKNILGKRTSSGGSGELICSVKGCENLADYYVDFSKDEVSFE